MKEISIFILGALFTQVFFPNIPKVNRVMPLIYYIRFINFFVDTGAIILQRVICILIFFLGGIPGNHTRMFKN